MRWSAALLALSLSAFAGEPSEVDLATVKSDLQAATLRRAQLEAQLSNVHAAKARLPLSDVPAQQKALELEAKLTAQKKAAEEEIAALTAQVREVEDSTARAKAELVQEITRPGWHSTEGYHRTLWGMSAREVRRLYPRSTQDGNLVNVLHARVGRYDCASLFYFVQGKLEHVVIGFPSDRSTARTDEARFDALARLLTKRYGDPEPADSGAMKWLTRKTEIVLSRGQSAYFPVQLQYESRELAVLEVDEQPASP